MADQKIKQFQSNMSLHLEAPSQFTLFKHLKSHKNSWTIRSFVQISTSYSSMVGFQCYRHHHEQMDLSDHLEQTKKEEKSTRILPFRIGHDFDLHRLEPGYPLIVEGIDIPHDRGCEAQYDGDVLLRCVVDAIFGALGLHDSGQIFPDSDPKWKRAASSICIKEAVRLMDKAGYEVGNLDTTLILQRPKISNFQDLQVMMNFM